MLGLLKKFDKCVEQSTSVIELFVNCYRVWAQQAPIKKKTEEVKEVVHGYNEAE